MIHDLTRRLSTEAAPFYIVQGRIQCAKYALLDLCFIRTIDLVQYSQPEVGKLMIKIHDMHADIFREMANLGMGRSSARFQEELPKKEKKYKDEIEVLKRQRNNLYDEVN